MKFYTAIKINKLWLIYILDSSKHDIKQKKPDTKESYSVIPFTERSKPSKTNLCLNQKSGSFWRGGNRQ